LYAFSSSFFSEAHTAITYLVIWHETRCRVCAERRLQ